MTKEKKIKGQMKGNVNPNFKDRTGEKFISNEGYEIEIVECINTRKCRVKIGGHLLNRYFQYDCIKKGQIRNPFHRSVQGIGYIGIGKFNTKKDIKIYYRWDNLLKRCYGVNRTQRNLSYEGCIVDEHWHNFQNFATWFEENWKEWMDSSWHIDKDIIFPNCKIYSPKTCTILPQEINLLFVGGNLKKDNLPIGVVKHNKKYRAVHSIDGKRVISSVVDTPEEAFQIYKKTKEDNIKRIATKWKDKISNKIYEILINYRVIQI